MDKGDTITSYFSKSFELRDQLSTIGNNVLDVELSLIALRGLPISWESFIQCISHPSIPKFDILKNERTQEEARPISRGIISNKEEEIQAWHINSSNKKGKFKRKRVKKKYKKETYQKLNVINATNMDILTCIVQKGRKILSTWPKSRK